MNVLKQMCRLCLQIKTSIEIMGEINDPVLGLKPKLNHCCRWREWELFENKNLPQNVCISCVQKLESCWEFAESVSAAQQTLLKIIENIKSDEMHTFDSSNSLECATGFIDAATQCEFYEDKTTIESMYVKEEMMSVTRDLIQPAIEHKLNEYNCSIQAIEATNEYQPYSSPNCKRNGVRKASITVVKTKRQKQEKAEKNSKEKFLRNIKVEGKKMVKPRKSTIPDDNFLTLIRSEDRNDDGTIKTKRILQLELGSWLMLQYQCYLCGTCLGDNYNLKQHLLEEHPQQPYKLLCSFCKKKKPRTLKRKQAMIDHTKIFHFPHLKYW